MSVTKWQTVANRVAKKLDIDEKEYRVLLLKYTLTLENEVRKLNHEQYDLFNIGKFAFNRRACLKMLKSNYVTNKLEDNPKEKEAFNSLRKILETKFNRNKKKYSK